jgi:hypothetical protein
MRLTNAWMERQPRVAVPNGRLKHGARPRRGAAMVCMFLLLGPCAGADAQDQAPIEPSQRPEAPPPGSAESERAVRPLPLLERSPATTLIQGTAPTLGTAQLLPPTALESVARPDQLRVGSFAILPTVEVAAAYDDNVNATKSDREDDIAANLAGRVRAQSLFARHSLGFEVGAALREFDEQVDMDQVDWGVAADGRLDLTPRRALSAAVEFTRGTESAESPEPGNQPTVTSLAGAIAYTQQLQRLGWQLGTTIDRFEAENGGGSDGGSVGDRDRTTYGVTAGADYQVLERLSAFLDTSYDLNDFDATGDGGSRDSQIVEVTLGTRWGIGRMLAASVGVGYIAVFFEDPERDTTQAPALEVSLDGALHLDRVTLLRLTLDHTTGITAVEDAALVTTSGLSATITRSLSQDSAVFASAGVQRNDYIDSDRTDHDIVAQLGYSRTLVRNVALNVGYRYSQRFSDQSEDEFYRNIVSLGLSAYF